MEKRKSTSKGASKKSKLVKRTVVRTQKRASYKYSKLGDLLSKELERVNVYGAVLDTSGTYYIDKIQKYICVLKLIDDTVNPNEAKGKIPNFISVTCFASTKDELPQTTKMGSILRIHRGDTRKFNKSFQLNCDVGIKAAWVTFDPTESLTPTNHTGRQYTFEDDDKKRLKEIRKFAEKFFKDNDATEFASIGANPEETDIFAVVLSRKSSGKNADKLSFFDGETFSKIEIPKERYKHIAPQDIIRIRGLKQKKGDFLVNDYTGILRIDKEHEAAKLLKKKIDKARKDKKTAEKLDSHIPDPEKSTTVSEIVGKKGKPTTLKELFALDSSKLKGQKFRVSVNVVEIGPKDPKNWILPVDAKARKQYNIPNDMKHYYKLQLFSKDVEATHDTNVYPLYLCTIDGKGQEFFPNPDEDSTAKYLKNFYKKIVKPWYVLDLLLEPVTTSGSNVFFIVDTKLTL